MYKNVPATDEHENPLSAEMLRNMDAWWRAANYLSVGQIYLRDNPLLRAVLLLRSLYSYYRFHV